jgi:hypothetical protein
MNEPETARQIVKRDLRRRRDPHEARRERQAWALEIVRKIGRPPEPEPLRSYKPSRAREKPPAAPELGDVYFLYACNRIKIGTSRNHHQRVLNEIVPYCPAPLFMIGTIPGGRSLEAGMHTRFSAAWAHSEWFELWPELREFLCEDRKRAHALEAAEDQYLEWLYDELATQLARAK